MRFRSSNQPSSLAAVPWHSALHQGLVLAVALTLGWGSWLSAAAPDAGEAADRFWTAHIAPLIKDHCAECHNSVRTKAGLDLTSLQTILRGGERGAAVIPGKPEESNLYKFLLADADPHMPPGKRKALSSEEAELVKAWIAKIPVVTNTTTGMAAAPAPTASGAVEPKRDSLGWHPPAGMDPSKVVDRFLQLAWKKQGIKPAQPASDPEVLRRLYLDLIGRIPTVEEAAQAMGEKGAQRRSRWIDQLLAHPEHARHLREIFDTVLMTRRGPDSEDSRAKHHWFDFLESAFRENRPWDQVVRQLILARPTRPEDKGGDWFLYERRNNAQNMAEAIAPLVYGVQIKCAQCHDHMVAREIKQAHYWGTVAAFLRSKNVDTPEGPAVGESAVGGFVSFANLKKESQPAYLTFFNQRQVEEPRPKEGEKELDTPDRYVVPPPAEKVKPVRASVPKFSRREAFAGAVTQDNPLLARAMVNRVWALLFGRGIVHPVDLMDSKHPPSHPELLDWLAEDFARSGYDVRRLIRLLCQTAAYQLDSQAAPKRATSPNSPKKPANTSGLTEADSFARFLPKPLTAEQLFRSLLAARGRLPAPEEKVGERTITDLRRRFAKEFPDVFAAEYQPSLQQALFLANSPAMASLIRPESGSLSERMIQLPDPVQRVRLAFQTLFLRPPDSEELSMCVDYLKSRPTESGVEQLLWSLFTSAEFQLNH